MHRLTAARRVVPQGTFSCGVAAIHLVAPYDKLQATIKEEAKGCDSMAEKNLCGRRGCGNLCHRQADIYRVPDELREQVQIGTRVLVPFGFGNKRAEAVVLAFREDAGEFKLKPIVEVLDETPFLTAEQLRLAARGCGERCTAPTSTAYTPCCPPACGSKRNETYTLAPDADLAALRERDGEAVRCWRCLGSQDRRSR